MVDPAEQVLSLLDVLDGALHGLHKAWVDDLDAALARFPDQAEFVKGVTHGALLAVDDMLGIVGHARERHLGLAEL